MLQTILNAKARPANQTQSSASQGISNPLSTAVELHLHIVECIKFFSS